MKILKILGAVFGFLIGLLGVVFPMIRRKQAKDLQKAEKELTKAAIDKVNKEQILRDDHDKKVEEILERKPDDPASALVQRWKDRSRSHNGT